MSALAKFIKEIDQVRRMDRTTYPSVPLPMYEEGPAVAGWARIATEARLALAALRKIRRVGYVPGNRSEESEIAAAALKRIVGKPKRRGQ